MVQIDKNFKIEDKKIKEEAFYIGKNDVIEVTIKDAVNGTKKIKPKNGYWIKKSALISEPKYKSTTEVLTFEDFKKKLPEVNSPYAGEDEVMYKPVYDKLTDRIKYFKHGRRNLTKISIEKAYETYLYDNGKKMATGGILGNDDFKYHSNIDGKWDEGAKIKKDVAVFILQGYLAGGQDLANEIVGQILDGVVMADIELLESKSVMFDAETVLSDKGRQQIKELIKSIKSKTENYADGGEIKPESYYRVFKNSKGSEIPVKIIKNPIFNKFDYWVNGSITGSFDSYDQAYAEIKNENFELY